jgi:hypothetical protein
MAWRFRKSFKIFPGVRLNIGKRGITSATVGRGGLTSTTIGKAGVKQNFTVPGTGLSYQTGALTAAPNGTRNAALVVGGLLFGVFALCVGGGLISAIISPPAANTSRPVSLSSTPSATPTSTPITWPTEKPGKRSKGTRNTQQLVATPLVSEEPKGSRKPRSGIYHLGPRGGCYYINSRGNKTYVEHSFCY